MSPLRSALLRWTILGGGLLVSTLLVLVFRPAAALLPYFCFAIIASLVLPLRQGILALLLSCAVSAFLLAHRPAPLPSLAWGIIVQAELWVLGTGAVVVGLTERSRRHVQAATRARENVLPLAAAPAPQHLYARMIDEAPDSVVVIDSAGKIVLANKQTEALFGYDRDDMLGQAVEILLPAHAQARHVLHRQGFMANPRTRVMGSGLELFARRADGFPFPVNISLSPLETDQTGSRQVLVMAVVRDITLSKATEEALARERAERAAAETAVAERDLWASLSSHELKTPLTSLRGYSELLVEAVGQADGLLADSALPPDYVRLRRQAAIAIAAIERQSVKMEQMVHRMLDVARLGQGTFSLEKQEGDLRVLVRETVHSARAAFPDLILALVEPTEVDGAEPAPLIFAFDALRLEQALLNLINNAARHSRDDVIVRLWRDGDEAVLAVEDRGPGIAPQERSRVVEKFYQIESSERSTGLGLGMFLADSLVQAHGGTLTIADNPGGGAIVTIRLPLSGSSAGTLR